MNAPDEFAAVQMLLQNDPRQITNAEAYYTKDNFEVHFVEETDEEIFTDED